MEEIIIQIRKLEKNIPLSTITYSQLVIIFSGFAQHLVKDICQKKEIDDHFSDFVCKKLQSSQLFFTQKYSEELLEKDKIEIWEYYDLQDENSIKELLLRAAVICFYPESDEKDEVFDTLELIFSLLNDIHPDYCAQFILFFENNVNTNFF